MLRIKPVRKKGKKQYPKKKGGTFKWL